jgi:uncharacterized protein (TIGR03437 family)
MDRLGRWNETFVAVLLCATAIALPAQTFTTLASFVGVYGSGPHAPLVQGTDGNLYGTTFADGAYGEGTVFKVTPAGILTTLYSFCVNYPTCSDGAQPSAGLIQASDGNFYGTQPAGGNGGTVFRITPGGTLTTLHSFCITDCADGAHPNGSLLQASDGYLYGTTAGGGASFSGTVFRMTLGGTLTTLYSFSCTAASCANGGSPAAGLIQASDGNFYGTTPDNIFKITPGGTLTTLYSFNPAAGGSYTGLVQATDGNFYGTTYLTQSTIFKVTPTGAFTTLNTLSGVNGGPASTLIQASDGNLYGTTSGPEYLGLGGTVFRITLGGTLTTLHTFDDDTNGSYPQAGLVQGSDGSLYGTTSQGGASAGPDGDYPGSGTIFRLTLSSAITTPAINESGGIVNGASFQAGIAAGSWITILGTNLSSITDNWTKAIVNGVLPISLDGVSVSVGGQPAYIYYISPTQINALAPNVGAGTVPVTVTNSIGTTPPIMATAQAFQPAFFLWPGSNYAVATTTDFGPVATNGTVSGVTTAPAKPGDVIVLWGTGFGPTNPTAPAGLVTPSTTVYNTAGPVTVTVGGVPATVYGAALAPGEAGLYQVAIQIPTSLANGNYPVIATISGAQSPSTTLITVQN